MSPDRGTRAFITFAVRSAEVRAAQSPYVERVFNSAATPADDRIVIGRRVLGGAKQIA